MQRRLRWVNFRSTATRDKHVTSSWFVPRNETIATIDKFIEMQVFVAMADAGSCVKVAGALDVS